MNSSVPLSGSQAGPLASLLRALADILDRDANGAATERELRDRVSRAEVRLGRLEALARYGTEDIPT